MTLERRAGDQDLRARAIPCPLEAMRGLAVVLAVGIGCAPIARASPASPAPTCTDELTQRGVAWRPTRRPGIDLPVEIDGALGGVRWHPAGRRPLVIDCSLAVSLAEAGPYFVAAGIERITVISAYARRNVAGTDRPSKHSYGLAIDVSRFEGDGTELSVAEHYEPGLGDEIDCLGQPATAGGAVLKVLQCQLVRSGLFHLVLSPDYDYAHRDHFHLEARTWTERAALRDERPAIH